MPKWPDETCMMCGKTITSRMKPRVVNDAIVCADCWYKAEADKPQPPTERQIRFAKDLGIRDPESYSFERLSGMIDKAIEDRDVAKDQGLKSALAWTFKAFARRIYDLQQITKRRNVARIEYRKAFDDPSTSRVVEIYQLQASDREVYVVAWQISADDDASANSQGWRHFRLDRISSLLCDDGIFQPRARTTIVEGVIHRYQDEVENPCDSEIIGNFSLEDAK